MASKKPKSERKTKKVEFMVTEDWHKATEAEAKSWNLTLSAYILLACEEKRRRDNAVRPDAD